ncbi:DNA repair protein RadA [soil metagenome]
MAKARSIFACKACGAIQSKWMGKCPDCNAWDSLEAERIEPKAKTDPRAASMTAFAARAGASAQSGAHDADPDFSPSTITAAHTLSNTRSVARPIGALTGDSAPPPPSRIATGIGEFDRVLGGGFVPGSAVLLGGDPGIGKSTILLQAAGGLAQHGTRTLYVSSEESAEQVALRAARLGAGNSPELYLLAETSLARIIDQAARVLGANETSRPPVLIIDSVQMVYKADLDAFPGSLTQLRRCCAELVYFAKASGVTVVLVGHVTKEGHLAGPRMLEHLVDAVMYFEGDRYHAHRIVRAVKNRFGTTLELGLFEMTGAGLKEAPHGAGLAMLSGGESRPGTIICPVLTGTRCLLIELQALTATGFLGAAKRKNSGVDSSRLAMLIAVLEQHAGMRLADRDIFASSVGGIKVVEPAADLALLLAIAGAHLRRAIAPGTAVVGEVGLGGEVRPVAQLHSRLHEAHRLGFKTLIAPAAAISGDIQAAAKKAGLTLAPVKTIAQAIEHLG